MTKIFLLLALGVAFTASAQENPPSHQNMSSETSLRVGDLPVVELATSTRKKLYPFWSSEALPAVAARPAAPDLGRNLTRGEMREVQTLLKAAGYDPGPADGLMGPKTRTAIASFGESHGVELTPEPQLKLLEALRAAAR